MILDVCFDVTPIPKGRPRMGGGIVYTPKRTHDFEKTISLLGRRAMGRAAPYKGALCIQASFVFKRPKRPAKPYPRPDVDNLVKALTDALNGIVWEDDSQIVSVGAGKCYGERDEIRLRVSRFEELPNQ